MSERAYAELTHRGVVALRGAPARDFLQGLISNDIEQLAPAQALWAALLTPQGKFLFEFMILEHNGEILLETERERLPQLVQRLAMYRLRTKVEIEDVSASWSVAALFGQGTAAALGLPERPGACRGLAGGLVLIDPRLPELGARAVLPPDELAPTLESTGFRRAGIAAYEGLRLRLGVPDGSRDLPVEKATLLESGFDELHGVDFKKGCFVGQELTARMKYRGLVRKRLMPVSFAGAPPPPGTIIRCGGKEAGEMRSAAEGAGLALLRLEQVERARAENLPLLAGELAVTPHKPGWAGF